MPISKHNIKIAYGPNSDLPSFEWVGSDIFKHINNLYQISVFTDYKKIKFDDYDIIVFIKHIPSFNFLIKNKGTTKIIYIPVDYFNSKHEVKKYTAEFHLFDCILIHTERLRSIFSNYSTVFFIEHYLKYFVNRDYLLNADNFILWIGHTQYIPTLMKYLSNYKCDNFEIKILIDSQNFSKRRKAIIIEMQEMGVLYNEDLNDNNEIILNGFTLEQWSIDKQYDYLQRCRAAIDTKNSSFSQSTKPPTKGQIYIANGIPLAVPKDSYTYEYFHNLGLDLPDINDLDRLLSEEFKKMVYTFSKKYKDSISIDRVSENYLNIISYLISIKPKKNLYIYLVLLKVIYNAKLFFIKLFNKLLFYKFY